MTIKLHMKSLKCPYKLNIFYSSPSSSPITISPVPLFFLIPYTSIYSQTPNILRWRRMRRELKRRSLLSATVEWKPVVGERLSPTPLRRAREWGEDLMVAVDAFLREEGDGVIIIIRSWKMGNHVRREGRP